MLSVRGSVGVFILPLLCLTASAFAEPKRDLPGAPALFDFAIQWMEDEDHMPAPLLELLAGNGPTPTATSTPTSTDTPTETPTETSSSTPSFTHTPEPTETPTFTPTPTATESPTPSPSPTSQTFPESGFVNFETPPVHPIDLSPDRSLLALCNLADYRVEIYDLTSGTPEHTTSIPVGVDPVTVRFRSDSELWVVNHISDSISIIDLSLGAVVKSLQTDDEPCDVVFAGTPEKAFVACSQVNRIQVFDLADLDADPGVIPIDGEDPRALALSPDGTRLYAAIFESGNASTILGGGADQLNTISFPPNVVQHPSGPYGGVNPPPNNGSVFEPPMNPALPPPPRVGLIVKKNDEGKWLDDNGADWTDFVSGPNAHLSGRVEGWDLPDHDVAIVDVESATVVGYATGMMNICMSLAVNPGSGKVTVVGTDGTNEVRFEPVINGVFLRVNLGMADPAAPASKEVVDLNPHLFPYSASTTEVFNRVQSVGDPRAIVWNSDGSRGYVAGMGSNNIVSIDSAGDRAGAGTPIAVGEGPAGLALDEGRSRLYVLNRFEGSLSVVDVTAEEEIHRIPFFDPTPDAIRDGRKHLYDTHISSGLGHVACGSCHIDSRMDRLGWDLGDPSGEMKPVTPGAHNLGGTHPLLKPGFRDFHPMKGPMTTQTLQDIIGHEPLHWRGDRDGLEEFNAAFVGLQGADRLLTPEEMQAFEDFLDTITFPPNPYRNFDNSLPNSVSMEGHYSTGRFSPPGTPLPTGSAVRGFQIYSDTVRRIDRGGQFACITCHTIPTGMGTDYTLSGGVTGNPIPFPVGPNGERHHALVSVDGSSNITLKVAQLRNQFEKTGFNMLLKSNRAGFGLLHDGSVDTIERFLSVQAFDVQSDQEVADLTALSLAFSGSDFGVQGTPGNVLNPPGPLSQDSHAAVGAQLTVDASDEAQLLADMKAVAAGGRADLVVRGVIEGAPRGFVYNPAEGLYLSDRNGESFAESELRSLPNTGLPLTFTLVPGGTGIRVGVDRDGDGWGDQTEIEAGTDPTDSADHPDPQGS